MSETIEFREVRNDEEASFLMPGRSSEIHLVMCCDAGAPAVKKAARLAPQVDLPSDWDLVVLDPEQASETARWFGIAEASGMAVIHDGVLLAIEFECSLDAFERLIDVAERQASQLAEMG